MNEKQLKENSSIHVFVVDFVGMQRSMRNLILITQHCVWYTFIIDLDKSIVKGGFILNLTNSIQPSKLS